MQRIAEAICESLANGAVSEETVESSWKDYLQPDYASVSFILPSNPTLVVAFGNLAVVGPVKAAVHHVARCAAGLALGENVQPPPPPQNAPRDLGWTDIKHAHKLGSKFVVVEPVPGWSSPAPCAVICLGWRKNVTYNRSRLSCASVKLLAEALGGMLRGLYNPLMKEVAGLTYWGTPVSVADDSDGLEEKLLTAADLEVDVVKPPHNTPKQLPAYMGYKRKCRPLRRVPADAVVSDAKQSPVPWGLPQRRSTDTLPPLQESEPAVRTEEASRSPHLPACAASDHASPPLVPGNSPEDSTGSSARSPSEVEVVSQASPPRAAGAIQKEGVRKTALRVSQREGVEEVGASCALPQVQTQVKTAGPSGAGVSASDIDAQFPSPIKPDPAAWGTARSGSPTQEQQHSGSGLMGTDHLHPFTLRFRDEATEHNYQLFSVVEHQQMDVVMLLAAAIIGVAYGRMRVRPDGSPSAWFTINPWAETYCLLQILSSIGMGLAILLHRDWYLKNRDWLIMARNFALLCLSGVFSVPWTAGPQCLAQGTTFKNFMTGLQLMQAFESWGSRVNFSRNIVFRSICLALCLMPVCCACARETSSCCVVMSTVSFAVLTHAIPLYINWRTEMRERTLFTTLTTFRPKQIDNDCCVA